VDVTINPWSGHISAATALMSAIHVSDASCGQLRCCLSRVSIRTAVVVLLLTHEVSLWLWLSHHVATMCVCYLPEVLLELNRSGPVVIFSLN
jgi:hypothetical protein